MVEKKKTSAKIIQFPRARPALSKANQAITGQGNVGVVGDGNHVQIHFTSALPSKTTKYVVQPGVQHIGAMEAAEVRELVAKTALVSGRHYSFVWSTVKRQFRFARYELLTPEVYEQVCRYLRSWIARHSRQFNGDTEELRKHLLKRIHAEGRKTPGADDRIHGYITGRFGFHSLAELSPEQLNEVIKAFHL